MLRIAVIISSYTRKEKTLKCLDTLKKIRHPEIETSVYLTDDGSTDGTYEAVSKIFPETNISRGNGSLYWGGGMNLSWKKAVKDGNYDGYLWLNDDTELKANVWQEIIDADKFSKKEFKKGGIYIGSTLSLKTNKISYGGWKQIKSKTSSFRIINPTGDFQLCDIGNGNITYISSNIVEKIGCLYDKYVHGADFDYVGYCENDHKSHKENLLKLNLKDRIKYLYSPTGLQFKTALLFQKRFFPHNTYRLWLSYWIKTLFPQLIK